ncbi:Large cysteine-rich periplasmic protein omcB precursor [Stieleria neptunia]|uniref:Large cysteine-rich periplasmic protein omcB n=1 Tax=Stieleria neptunia TaxID=2527979 RepID=A0A518I096_9BACT|nr:DUF11 domain-containing protein [Stieleria neptunia]QDV46447.1 Large cysteine-rich periplasmic protein omcB precursor [Stieleria neptunia]
MKAFGVRLAAGAVTILLGAIMAAQAQKDQEASTESAWTEEQIPPGKAVSPIAAAAGLQSADPDDVELLKPVGEPGSTEASASPSVRLVQHTESSDSMVLPELPADSGNAPQPENSVGGRSVMKMRLPSFDDAPPLDADADAAIDAPAGAGGPSFSMGLPVADAPAASLPDHPQMSEITFAETPSDNGSQDVQVGNGLAGGDLAGNELAGQPPANDLPANDLRGGTFADSQTLDPNAGLSAAAAPRGFDRGASLTDTVDPNAGMPSAMLTPVVEDAAGPSQPRFADAPGSTMRIHREPAMTLEIGATQFPMQDETEQPAPAASSPAMSPATLGITSQPQIVGNGQVADSTPSPSHQPAAATTGQGYMQPSGGFAAPDSYPMAAAPQLPAPSLGAPMPRGGNMQPQGMQPQSGTNPGAAYPATAQAYPAAAQAYPAAAQAYPAAAQTPGNSVYQGVGYQQTAAEGQQPAGPTLASPGERYLDGPQSPSVVIHKRAPAEVTVGKPASFVITVKNVGGSKALNVQVHDRVPNGMTLTDATPRPNPKYQPQLYWELGDLEPNQERTITLQLTPEQEGELGSVARVTFQAAASVRTISTRPELRVVQRAPEKVLIGQQLEIELEVSNPGTGEATGVILQEDVPVGLEHPQGTQLDNLIGTLGPGEIRRQVLRMRAVQAGVVQNQIRVKGDDGLETTHSIAVEVVAPELKATLTGPSRRFLERQATYTVEIANVGTAEAQNVEMSVQLDRGFTFVKTDYEGQYDASRHAVFWSLDALPVGQSGKVPLTLLPVEEGNRVLQTVATADLGIKTMTESQVEVASLAELTFSINDTADPIEIGGDTIYEIRISNTGSRDDTNVKVALQLPQGLQLVEQGDFTPQGQGIIAFSPRALLKANDEMVYRVKARGVAEGRHLVKAIVTSDQSNVPVTKEESIMVYADR